MARKAKAVNYAVGHLTYKLLGQTSYAVNSGGWNIRAALRPARWESGGKRWRPAAIVRWIGEFSQGRGEGGRRIRIQFSPTIQIR
ncbi:hypothetical protein CHELA20_53360 [Hyphomicrobiales bacterium]|nr:hypothetical protein CHELA41_21566 [Hyphomicrobiales bacterium]CAH1684094.1 hypothetical protein CHELA20_53360 [Hyphomicrobiales bacterium]